MVTTHKIRVPLIFILLVPVILVSPGVCVGVTVIPSCAPAGNASYPASLVLDEAPSGLSGYSATLTAESGVEVFAVQFPAWALLSSHSPLPSGAVVLTAVDLNNQVTAGARGVVLAEITLSGGEGLCAGINGTKFSMDDDQGMPGTMPGPVPSPIADSGDGEISIHSAGALSGSPSYVSAQGDVSPTFPVTPSGTGLTTLLPPSPRGSSRDHPGVNVSTTKYPDFVTSSSTTPITPAEGTRESPGTSPAPGPCSALIIAGVILAGSLIAWKSR
jgi:hypothetical protein